MPAALLALLSLVGGTALAGPLETTQRLGGLGINRALAQRASRHVALGLPSNATRQNLKDLLLVRNGYVISYNGDRNAMNWASWSVQGGDLGAVDRQERFRPDPTLPKSLYRPTSADYKIPGYSRGHMIRSGERTATVRENAKTYVFSNMLPQAVNNNAGPWNAFEDYYRNAVKQDGLVAHVMAGGVFGAAPVAERNVKVPSATWKIVALLKPGQTAEQIDEHTRVMSIVVPNNNDDVKVEHNWDRYRVSVNDIERQTGLKFFDQIPAAVAATLKARVDSAPIPPPGPRQFTPHNYGTPPVGAIKAILAKQVTGTVKMYSSDKRYGFIKLADGTDIFVHASQRKTTIAAGEQVTFDIAEGHDGRRFASGVTSTSPLATPKNDAN